MTDDVASFFEDPDASSAVVLAAQQIAAPMVKGALLTMDETGMGGGLRVCLFILDGSPSMVAVAQALRNGFNQDFVPAVRAAREDDISALRVGGVAFSSGSPQQIWRGSDGSYFHPFDQLPELTEAEYDPNRGYGTALHRAILEGSAIAFRYAAELQQQTGMDVDVDVVILSDGANTDQPSDPTQVKQMIVGRDKSRVRYLFFYFETEYGLSVTRPTNGGLSELEDYVVHGLGIDGEQVVAFARKPGESEQDRAKRFRALLQVMSRVSAARNTSAVVAASSVLDDDELV